MADVLSFSFELTGLDEFDAYLDCIVEAVSDLHEPLALIRDDFSAAIGRRFADEGPGWAPLAPSTVVEKARAGYGGQGTLVRTGDMLRDLTNPDGEIDADSLTLWPESDTPFIYHEYGTRRMPARPPVVIEDGDVDRWVGIVDDFLGRILA
jgi:hypothetical protein